MKIIISVPTSGCRIGVFSPYEAYEVMQDLLEDYSPDEIEWELWKDA